MTENTETSPTLDTQFSDLGTQLSTMNTSFRDLQQTVKNLAKEVKSAEKKSRNRPKAPQKPMQIDSKLAAFIKVNSDNHITKAEVMKHISQYIKDNNLQVETDKRQFV